MGKAVKDRNEPCAVGGMAWVVHKLHGVSLDEVAARCWENTVELFQLHELDAGAPSGVVSEPTPAA